MGAKNKVVAGEYSGKEVKITSGKVAIVISFLNYVYLNKDTVESYELITEDKRKSAVSGVARGAVGAVLLGPVGLLAGMSAKNKGTYNVAVLFKDGKNSLLEVDDKIYKSLMHIMF